MKPFPLPVLGWLLLTPLLILLADDLRKAWLHRRTGRSGRGASV